MSSRELKFIDKVLEETGFLMMYPPKVDRAVYGMSTSHGYSGGVGEEADSKTILAKYDQLGGYITKDGYPVKYGTFHKKGAKEFVVVDKPDVVLLIKVNGEVVEHREGDNETLELKVAKKQISEKVKATRGRPKKEVEAPEPPADEKTLDA